MRTWTFPVPLDRTARAPLFLQIAQAITIDVRRGRLRPGDRLPGSRSLAQHLGVQRNTVVSAYAELEAEGWIVTSSARGSFVSPAIPSVGARRLVSRSAGPAALADRPAYELGARAPALPPPAPPGALVLASASPDTSLIPAAALARAYRKALHERFGSVLAHGDPRGHPRLRAALASMLSAARGVAASSEHVLVTRGSQMGYYLIARALVRPGDLVAVEELGYPPSWEALRLAGAELAPIPLDRSGLRTDALAALLAKRPVRAVILTSHHQYPTTVPLAAGRRLELLAMAEAAKTILVEDDFDHEFHYEGRPILPLASADRAGVVVYLGTLSKVIAPGLRVGFVVAPAPVVDRLAAFRRIVDRQGDHAVERAVAELLEDGELERHARRTRLVYRARRDALVHALHARLGSAVKVEPPSGGVALWAEVARGIDVDAWAECAKARGVSFATAQSFALDGRPRPFARLGFASLSEPQLLEAAQRLSAALDDASRRPHSCSPCPHGTARSSLK